MRSRELQQSGDADRLLTVSAGLDRLLGMMARWWEGWSLDRIAREYGVRRQRVAALLARVDCTRVRRCQADHDRPDSGRRAHPVQISLARATLLHPLARRLTVRQRAALAWQASGLVLVDIARRMGTTPQNVRNLQVAGRWRLDRLSRTGLDQCGKDGEGVTDLDWSGIVQEARLHRRTAHSFRRIRHGRAEAQRVAPKHQAELNEFQTLDTAIIAAEFAKTAGNDWIPTGD